MPLLCSSVSMSFRILSLFVHVNLSCGREGEDSTVYSHDPKIYLDGTIQKSLSTISAIKLTQHSNSTFDLVSRNQHILQYIASLKIWIFQQEPHGQTLSCSNCTSRRKKQIIIFFTWTAHPSAGSRSWPGAGQTWEGVFLLMQGLAKPDIIHLTHLAKSSLSHLAHIG